MSTMLLQNLRARWETVRGQLDQIADGAAEANRDLTDGEQANFDALRAELDELSPRIEQMTDLARSTNATAGMFADLPSDGKAALQRQSAVEAQSDYESAGHYLLDLFRSRQIDDEYDPEARTRIQRAAADITTSEISPIVPEPVIGSIWSGIDASRPLANSFTNRPITAPLFFRPKVVQHTQVGPQGTAGIIGNRLNATNDEKKELVSREMKLGRVNVEPVAVGGVVDISLWAETFSPNLLNSVVADLAKQYSIQTEAIAAAELARAGTASAIPAIAALDGKSVQAALYEAAAQAYQTVGMLPRAVAMSTDVWAAMGAFTDTTDRPLYPAIAPQNASATQMADSFTSGPLEGLRRIVSPGLPPKSLIVFDPSGMEFFERRLGVLQVIEPERVGRLVSYSGLVAAIAIDDGAAVSIPLP